MEEVTPVLKSSLAGAHHQPVPLQVLLRPPSIGRRTLGEEASRTPVTNPQRDLVEEAEATWSKLKRKGPWRHEVGVPAVSMLVKWHTKPYAVKRPAKSD
jgi:hypothetical protein